MTVYLYLVSGHKVWQCIAIFCQYFHFLTPLHSPNRPMRVVVCVRWKLALERREEKKQSWNVPEDTLTILVLLWPFDLFQSKYGAKQLVYHDQHPIWPPEGAQCQTNSTKQRTAAPSVNIFTPREIYVYHAAFKHENIGHNKMKRKVLYYRLPVHCQYVQCARRSPAYRN